MTAEQLLEWATKWITTGMLLGLFAAMLVLLFGAIYFEIRDYWRSERDR